MKVSFRRACSLMMALALLLAAGCGGGPQEPPPADTGYTRYTTQFYDTFNTIVQVTGYTRTQEEFEGYAEAIHQRFVELNRLYDRFYEYSGVNNIRTINKNAGIAPVKAAPELLDMLTFARDWCQKTGGRVNIAMGPPL